MTAPTIIQQHYVFAVPDIQGDRMLVDRRHGA